MTRNYTKFLVFFGLVFVLFSVCRAANAATLYFSPSSGSYTVGGTLSVGVFVSSADQAMNAASGIISFPPDKLEVVSISKSGSIFTLWVQEPSFSNSAGTVDFEGIVLNPGFTGASGKVITINFRVKAAGTALLNFSSGSVLANDGKGTNILASLGNAQFSLGGAAPTIPEATAPPKAIGGALPAAPIISSPTHPDPDKWYALKDAKFIWSLPAGITEVALIVNKIPQSAPTTITYKPPINSKEVTELEDGVWYFHLRLRNKAGWGAVSNFRFQIDTRPPEPFSIKFADGKETDNPRPVALFDTIDSLSGLDFYRVKIGEGDFFNLLSNEIVKNNLYTLPLQMPGKKTIIVQAYDKAENYTTASEEFIIKPINSPIIAEYPQKLQSGEILTIKGETYPNSQVIVWLQKDAAESNGQTVKSDEKGKFIFIAGEKMTEGIWKIWAEAVDERGARSNPTEKLTIGVEPPAILKIGSQAVSFLAVIIPLIALIILLGILLWYGWHRFSLMRKKIKKEVREAEQALHKSFDLLKEDIREQIQFLERTKTKRQLTKEEEKILAQLKQDLDDAEKFVRKEIEDIEKEL